MLAHGLVMAVCAGADSAVGVGSATAMLTCAGMTVSGTYQPYMVGIHVALLLQAIGTGVCGVQALRSAFLEPICGEAGKYEGGFVLWLVE